MISVGFDPAFIDIIIKALDSKGAMISRLPSPGHHHRNVKVEKIAGGNGVNVAYVLEKLNIPSKLVIPTNNLFSKLLEKRGLEVAISIHNNVNETYAITWGEGEIQFNHVTAELNYNHWTFEIHELWKNSPINLFLNWGLNPKCIEWISLQWLGSCGWEFEELPHRDDLLNTALEVENISKPIFIEPGSFENHKEKEQIYKLLNHICKSNFKKIFPILLYNEEEAPLFTNTECPSKIFHSPEMVKYIKDDDVLEYSVDKIKNVQNLVGAGDSFLAGLITDYYNNTRINIPQGIKVARKFVEGSL